MPSNRCGIRQRQAFFTVKGTSAAPLDRGKTESRISTLSASGQSTEVYGDDKQRDTTEVKVRK